jgi:hypothetical protein
MYELRYGGGDMTEGMGIEEAAGSGWLEERSGKAETLPVRLELENPLDLWGVVDVKELDP